MSGQVTGQVAGERPPVGRNLKAEMSRTGRTAEQVALALGVRERLVRRWVSESPTAVTPSWENVRRLAELFDRPAEFFYTDHERAAA